MKNSFVLFALGLLLTTCTSQKEVSPDILPEETWENGCLELAPYQGGSYPSGYRITGICCTTITFPSVELSADKSFSVSGTASTFTGASVADSPLTINGKLAADGSLTIVYTLGNKPNTYVFKPGHAMMACQCACL